MFIFILVWFLKFKKFTSWIFLSHTIHSRVYCLIWIAFVGTLIFGYIWHLVQSVKNYFNPFIFVKISMVKIWSIFKTVLMTRENKVHVVSVDCDALSICAEPTWPRVKFYFVTSLLTFSFYDISMSLEYWSNYSKFTTVLHKWTHTHMHTHIHWEECVREMG